MVGSTRAAAGSRRLALAAAAALLAGCAATPAPLIDLSGTNWRVVQVNSRPTPAVGDYSMRFEQGGQAGVRLGCNHMGGRYAITGDILTLSDFATTLMGCPEPAGTFEQEGSLVLSRPMRMALTSNERLTLSNEAGSIALDPVP